MSKTIAIVGSRNFNNQKYFNLALESIQNQIKNVTHFVSGGAKGADLMGQKWAEQKGLEIKIFYPDWNKHGRAAGVIRNTDIVKNSDIIIAFPSKQGRGTQDSIRKATKLGKELYVFTNWE